MVNVNCNSHWLALRTTGCISESGVFVTLFFLVQQHWGGCRYHHFAANFKVF